MIWEIEDEAAKKEHEIMVKVTQHGANLDKSSSTSS
jgi:hypothetical protein